MRTTEQTAIHEAGHAVAHFRLGLEVGHVTIVPTDSILGAVSGPGADHAYDAGQANTQAVAYLAGYAALVAAGFSEREAMSGAEDDFDHVTGLIDFWHLASERELKAEAVAMMRRPENVAAVSRVAYELVRSERIGGDIAECLVDLADGTITEADLARCRTMRPADYP